MAPPTANLHPLHLFFGAMPFLKTATAIAQVTVCRLWCSDARAAPSQVKGQQWPHTNHYGGNQVREVLYPDWFIDFSCVTNTPCAAWPPALPFVSVAYPSMHCPLLSAGEVPVCQHHLLPEPPAAKLQHPHELDNPAHTSTFNSLWLAQVNKAQQLQMDSAASPQWTCIPPLSARKPI